MDVLESRSPERQEWVAVAGLEVILNGYLAELYQCVDQSHQGARTASRIGQTDAVRTGGERPEFSQPR